MDFVDIQFPPRIALGAQRFPGWSTGLVQTFSGREFTDQRWSKARHRYELALAVRTSDDYATVLDHFHSVRGKAKAFPFRDCLDYRVEASRGLLVDNGDSPTLGYQLAKRYGTGSDRYERWITRPTTAAIYRLRSGVTTDITASSTISLTTGFVTITGGTVHVGDVLSWSGQFNVPCRYDTDELPTQIVNRQPGANGQLLVQCDSIPICEVRDPS